MDKLENFKFEEINEKNDPNYWFKGYHKSPWGDPSDLKKLQDKEIYIYYARGDYKGEGAYIYDLISKRIKDERGEIFIRNYLYNKLLDFCRKKIKKIKKEKENDRKKTSSNKRKD